MNRHPGQWIGAAVLAGSGVYVLYANKAPWWAGLAFVLLGVAVAIPANVGQALSVVKPVLDRVPMSQAARQTIQQKIDQSQLPPETAEQARAP